MFLKILLGSIWCRLTDHRWTDVELDDDGEYVEYERCPRCHTFKNVREGSDV